MIARHTRFVIPGAIESLTWDNLPIFLGVDARGKAHVGNAYG